MAHKGYTLNYFIEYFSSIPDHQWCVGDEQKKRDTGDVYSSEGKPTVQHCALGHAKRNARTTLDRTKTEVNGRVNALNRFLNEETADINDATPGDDFYKLGKTPRGRILKALRNRQKYGHVLGKQAALDAAADDAQYSSDDYGYDEYY